MERRERAEVEGLPACLLPAKSTSPEGGRQAARGATRSGGRFLEPASDPRWHAIDQEPKGNRGP